MAFIVNAFAWGIGVGAVFASAKREVKQFAAKRRGQ
jgi:hypothetical protein